MRRTLKGGILDEEGNKLELVVPQVKADTDTPEKSVTSSMTAAANGFSTKSVTGHAKHESPTTVNQTAQYSRLSERPLRNKHSSVLNRYKEISSK